MSPYNPSGYHAYTPTPHTSVGGSGGVAVGGSGSGGALSAGYTDINGADYVDSTTFDTRQTPIEPLPDSNLVSPVVSTGTNLTHKSFPLSKHCPSHPLERTMFLSLLLLFVVVSVFFSLFLTIVKNKNKMNQTPTKNKRNPQQPIRR